MTYVITEACIDVQDRACVDVCPVDCIHEDADNDRMLYIDPIVCIDCSACEPECPVGAIFAEDEVPKALQHFTKLNEMYFQDKTAVRLEINRLYPGVRD